MNEQHAPDLLAALRAAADLVENYPDLPDPYVTAGSWGHADVAWQLTITHKSDEQKAEAARIVKTLGGRWDKEDLGETFFFRQQRGPLRLRVAVGRETVCERIVTGTETVTVPAVEARPQRIEEREIVEWHCAPLLADAEVSA